MKNFKQFIPFITFVLIFAIIKAVGLNGNTNADGRAYVDHIGFESENDKILKSFPDPKQGFVKKVLFLESKSEIDEPNFKVELVIGNEIEVDCNHYWYTGDLEKKLLEGLQYPYYELNGFDGPMRTLKACGNYKNKMEFVGVNMDYPFLRYNSRLPIVVYVPEIFEVGYKIWTTDQIVRNSTSI